MLAWPQHFCHAWWGTADKLFCSVLLLGGLLSGVLEQEQFDAIFNRITQSGQSKHREMAIPLSSGVQGAMEAGSGEENSGSIGVLPIISTDGKTVDLTITSTLSFPAFTAPK